MSSKPAVLICGACARARCRAARLTEPTAQVGSTRSRGRLQSFSCPMSASPSCRCVPIAFVHGLSRSLTASWTLVSAHRRQAFGRPHALLVRCSLLTSLDHDRSPTRPHSYVGSKFPTLLETGIVEYKQTNLLNACESPRRVAGVDAIRTRAICRSQRSDLPICSECHKGVRPC